MSLYQVAFICSGLLVFPLAVIQVILRRQVHDANYRIGSSEPTPWDPRFVKSMFGTHGIWTAHKKAHERGVLRSLLLVLSVTWLLSVLIAVIAFLVKSQ